MENVVDVMLILSGNVSGYFICRLIYHKKISEWSIYKKKADIEYPSGDLIINNILKKP